jgi:hypothetical protein
LVFQPSLFSKTLPPFQKNSSPLFAAASKGSGAAACAWGAGDTKPGQPALLPTLEGLGQRHAHGENGVYTILGFFSFFLFIFLFLWGSKNGLQQMPPLYNTYGAEILCSKFYKDK